MKKQFQIIRIFILFFTLLSISGCEKDLYEEAIQLPERQNKINYVTIDQVPFLIPEIQEFNHDYDYLTSTSKSVNKDALNLNLDLNKILEYVTANGLKSYSIKIINQFEEYDDKYFENLSIYEKDGELQSFILKYNSIEDDKEFDYNTFTGEIDLYNLDKDLAGIIQYENGENKCIKIVVGGWHIVDFGGGDLYCWYEGGSGGGGGASGGSAGSGTGTGGTGTGTGATGSSGSGSSGTGGTGSGYTGGGTGGSSPVTANPVRLAEQWIYNLNTNSLSFCSEQFFSLSTEAQTLMINYIIQNNYTGTNLNSAKLYLRNLIKNPNGAFNFLLDSSTQTQTSVFNYLIQNNFNSQSTNFVNELINIASTESNQDDVNNLINLTMLINDAENNLFEDSFALTLDPYVDIDMANTPDPIEPNLFVVKTFINYKKLRQLNPEWSRTKCLWEATKDIVHLSLDAFGLIPVGGEIADLANGVLYTIEGDGLNATLSYASAVPILGWATVSTKYGIKVVNQVATISTKVKLVWKVSHDVISFGNRAQLRKVLGLAVGNPLVAHHIIPWAKQGHEIIQKLEAFRIANPNATPNQCYNAIMSIIDDVRTAIANNPNTPINLLNF